MTAGPLAASTTAERRVSVPLMRFDRLRLENWKNFRSVDVPLKPRTFLVGPNAAGKSNLLDALRFLHDVAQPRGGGLQAAIEDRLGLSHVRSLHARQQNNVVIEVEVSDGADERWRYRLELTGDKRRPEVVAEVVHHRDESVLDRPDAQDRSDPERLRQTHLEQVAANQRFRSLAEFFAGIRYLHLVPQLLRESKRFEVVGRDPLGSDFIRRLVEADRRTRESRLRRICTTLQAAVPDLQELRTVRDSDGTPHLEGRFRHWRPGAGWQTERQFSDGTLRLMALLWIVADGSEPLLLEEPELSLHPAVVREIPRLLHRISHRKSRQVLLSTHSHELLEDQGIDLGEILMVTRGNKEGSEVTQAAKRAEIRELLEQGMSPGRAVMPFATAPTVHQGLLFED